jgi:hypothetical protein
MRVLKNKHNVDWEENKQAEIKELTSSGVVPIMHELEHREKSGNDLSMKERMEVMPMLMGQAAGAIAEGSVVPAADIIAEMVNGAIEIIQSSNKLVVKASAASVGRARL